MSVITTTKPAFDIFSDNSFSYTANIGVPLDNSLEKWVIQNPTKARQWIEDYEKMKEQCREMEEKRKNDLIKNKNRRLRNLVKHIHFSGNTCIIYWTDGTQTKSHWDEFEDDFDPEKAILAAMARKLYENTGIYNEVLQKYSKDGWDHFNKNIRETPEWEMYI